MLPLMSPSLQTLTALGPVTSKEAPTDCWTVEWGGTMQILSWSLVVLLASSVFDLKQELVRFAAECEPAGMRVSTSMAIVLYRKTVDCLQLKSELLPQAKEFKYQGLLITSDGKVERELDRKFGVAWVGIAPDRHAGEEAEPEGKAFNFTSPSPFYPSPSLTTWSQSVVVTEIMSWDTCRPNELVRYRNEIFRAIVRLMQLALVSSWCRTMPALMWPECVSSSWMTHRCPHIQNNCWILN